MNPACRKIRERMSEALDARLTGSERARFQEHLDACPACTQEWRSLGEIRATLLDLPVPAVPAGMAAAIMREVRAAPRPADAFPERTAAPDPAGGLWRRAGRWRVAASILLLILVGTIILEERPWDTGGPPPGDPGTNERAARLASRDGPVRFILEGDREEGLQPRSEAEMVAGLRPLVDRQGQGGREPGSDLSEFEEHRVAPAELAGRPPAGAPETARLGVIFQTADPGLASFDNNLAPLGTTELARLANGWSEPGAAREVVQTLAVEQAEAVPDVGPVALMCITLASNVSSFPDSLEQSAGLMRFAQAVADPCLSGVLDQVLARDEFEAPASEGVFAGGEERGKTEADAPRLQVRLKELRDRARRAALAETEQPRGWAAWNRAQTPVPTQGDLPVYVLVGREAVARTRGILSQPATEPATGGGAGQAEASSRKSGEALGRQTRNLAADKSSAADSAGYALYELDLTERDLGLLVGDLESLRDVSLSVFDSRAPGPAQGPEPGLAKVPVAAAAGEAAGGFPPGRTIRVLVVDR